MKSNILQEGIIIAIFTGILLVIVATFLALIIRPTSQYAYFSEIVSALQTSCSSSQYFTSLNFQNSSSIVFQTYDSGESCLLNYSSKYFNNYLLCYGSLTTKSVVDNGVDFENYTGKGLSLNLTNTLINFCNYLGPYLKSITCFPITCNGLNSYVSNGEGQLFLYIYDTKIPFVEITSNNSYNYLFITPPQRNPPTFSNNYSNNYLNTTIIPAPPP